jgi:hypothetical protein
MEPPIDAVPPRRGTSPEFNLNEDGFIDITMEGPAAETITPKASTPIFRAAAESVTDLSSVLYDFAKHI